METADELPVEVDEAPQEEIAPTELAAEVESQGQPELAKIIRRLT